MARKLNVEDLVEAISNIEDTIRDEMRKELIAEFIDSVHDAQTDPDEVAGLRAAAEFIDVNWGVDYLDKYEAMKYRS